MCYMNIELYILRDLVGVFLLICCSDVIEKNATDNTKRILSKISYASMFAYLFHREFYGVFKKMFNLADGTIPVYGIIIAVILIFAGGYYMQKSYDWIISKLEKQ